MTKQAIIVYTDGACSGNPGPGGYAAVIEQDGNVVEVSGYEPQSTNQRMEMMGAVVGLEHTPIGSKVILHSDSAYVVRAWDEGWLTKWQKNGWQNSKREPVANQDLWQRLLQLAGERDVQWKKVAGHAGDPRNERCDELARQAIKDEGQAKSAKTDGAHLLVLNKDANSVMYVSLAERRIVKTIAVDKNPHEVVVSPDGKHSYVTCSGGDTLLAFDNESMELTKRVTHPDFRFPHGLAITRDGQRLLLASTRSGKFFIFELPSLEVKQVYATGQDSVHMVSLSPDEKLAYIANIRSDNVTIFDLEQEAIVCHLPVGRGPEGVAVHPDGNTIYVANQHDNDVYILDAENHSVLHTLKMGSLPIRLVFSPDGRYAFVPNRESGDLSIIDCDRPLEIKRIRVGVWPGGVVFDNLGEYAYVANNKTNDVSVIDVASLKEIERIDVGIHPDGIAFLQR